MTEAARASVLEMFEPDDPELNKVLPAALAAQATGVPTATLRKWANRPHTGITRHQGGYQLAEIRAWLDRRRTSMIR
jgi:hypothetical protein